MIYKLKFKLFFIFFCILFLQVTPMYGLNFNWKITATTEEVYYRYNEESAMAFAEPDVPTIPENTSKTEKDYFHIDFDQVVLVMYTINADWRGYRNVSFYDGNPQCVDTNKGQNEPFSEPDKGLGGGIGIKVLNYNLDYAVVPYSDLGTTQRISFSAAF